MRKCSSAHGGSACSLLRWFEDYMLGCGQHFANMELNRVRRAALAVLIGIGLTLSTTAAWAYDETGKSANPGDCAACHGVDSVSIGGTGVDRQGPHGGYTTTTRSCAGCHSVHRAPEEGYMLLPGATLTETCQLCHDGTGGQGVYGVLKARGLTVASTHRTETTSSVPGANVDTGGGDTAEFFGAGGTLSCGDCHSAHGASTVESFTTDRSRIPTDTTGFVSNELLRRLPSSATTETAEYGSNWCGGCHKGRVSGVHDIINHPVDAGWTSAVFTYENLQVVEGVASNKTIEGTLGHSNFGYVMPFPRTAGQGTHAPICQQCHEDVRNVGDQVSGKVSAGEEFSVTSSDGTNATDNPRFQVFPHESTNPALLLESGDDLCTNCHHKNQLP